jgi:uncharacterized protein YdeI (YjbR/CyaY-like superfamily)
MAAERPELSVSSGVELREWLEANHDSSEGVWLVTFKKDSGGTHLGYDEVLDELLAFGWIDSVQRRVDERRSKLQITPRKPKSNWSKRNRDRADLLIAEGRVAPPGLAMIEMAKETGTWTALDAVERLEVPDDLRAALDNDAKARAYFDAFPPSTRRAILEWISMAKRESTRATRIAETVELAAENLRVSDWPRPKRGTGSC